MIDETLIALFPKLLDVTIDASVWMFWNPHLPIPVLLIEFIVLMKIWYAVKDTGKWYVKPIKYASGFFFLPQDFVVRHTAMAVLMLDTPQFQDKFPWVEPTVTAQMKRYKEEYEFIPKKGLTGLERWRLYFSTKLCHILNKSDKQGHC